MRFDATTHEEITTDHLPDGWEWRVGMYDRSPRTMRLYANGVLAAHREEFSIRGDDCALRYISDDPATRRKIDHIVAAYDHSKELARKESSRKSREKYDAERKVKAKEAQSAVAGAKNTAIDAPPRPEVPERCHYAGSSVPPANVSRRKNNGRAAFATLLALGFLGSQ